jgi:hybrid cluster-associated redox disulfide protein
MLYSLDINTEVYHVWAFHASTKSRARPDESRNEPRTGEDTRKNMNVTKKTTVREVLREGPAVVRVFKKHRLHCMGCGGAVAETLETCALTHGLDPDKLVDEIKRAINGESG